VKDKDVLIRCAIANLRVNHSKRYRGVVLWGLIADIFGLGSTSSIELCKFYEFDPWEKLK
jgi:hypothetical protein